MGLLPVELLRAGSMAKVLDHGLLNRLGIQVARAMVAHEIHSLRRVHLRGAATAEQLETFDRDGIIAIENFLPADRFAALKREALSLRGPDGASVHQHGPNILIQRSLTDLGNLPELSRFFEEPVLLDLFEFGERAPVDLKLGLRAVEELIQGPDEGKDPETDLHTDIFFPTHKGWLYLDDVVQDNAPFVYVKGSHRMQRERLPYEYGYSCSGDRRSRRITPEEVERRGLTETVFELPANTLVVANVCGYHRRVRGRPGQSRLGLHMSLRRNPFLPRFVDPFVPKLVDSVRWGLRATRLSKT